MHSKIKELRDLVGYKPIYTFMPNRKMYDVVSVDKKFPKRDDSDNPRLIRQYFCIWGIPDDYGTRPVKGCFSKSIRERGPESSASNKIIILNNHNQKEPLCVPIILKEDEIGLYGEYIPDEGIQSNDDLVIRVKSGTINGGSYGFHYIWDKMEWNEKDKVIDMYECELFECSPCTFPSQVETFVVRNSKGVIIDDSLEEDTESLIRKIPRNLQLETRSLINRHISLLKSQPQKKESALRNKEPKQRKINYKKLINGL